MILKDIKRMSGGTIEIDEESINNLRSDYKQHLSSRPQKGRQQNQPSRSGHQQQKSRNGFQQRGYQKNNRQHNLPK